MAVQSGMKMLGIELPVVIPISLEIIIPHGLVKCLNRIRFEEFHFIFVITNQYL